MALERLAGVLQHHRKIALDTPIFIYQLEAHSRYIEVTDFLFAWLERPGRSAVTSTITMTEVLVQPYRIRDDLRVDEVYALLSTYPNLEWIAPDLKIADMAAAMRARYGLRTPDALQAATAICSRATLLVSNDRAFRRVEGIRSLLLDDIL